MAGIDALIHSLLISDDYRRRTAQEAENPNNSQDVRETLNSAILCAEEILMAARALRAEFVLAGKDFWTMDTHFDY